MKITFEDHSAEVLGALDAAVGRALEKCGLVAEGYAKKLCPVDTGNLRNSITHTVTTANGLPTWAQTVNTAYTLSAVLAFTIRAEDKRRGYIKTLKAMYI